MALLDTPIIIIGCNRSGTTLLFNNLAAHPVAWSLPIESQEIFHRHYPVDAERGERVIEPPTAEVARDIHAYFYRTASNRECFKETPLLRHVSPRLVRPWMQDATRRPPLRLVEKTPANSLRIPMLARLFPDAKFLFLIRRGEDVVSSLMEGWKNWSGTGAAWRYAKWHYLTPPGWQEMRNRPLHEICAFQWVEANRTAWEDLNTHCAGRFMLIRHEEAMAAPIRSYEAIRAYCNLPQAEHFTNIVRQIGDRVFTTGGSRPRKEKWREMHGTEIESIRHLFEPLHRQLYGPPRVPDH